LNIDIAQVILAKTTKFKVILARSGLLIAGLKWAYS